MSKNNNIIYLKRILYVAVLVICFVSIYKVLDYLLSDDTNSQTRITLHDFYEEENVDYVFVGPSHTIHGINAVYLSEKLGKDVFNLSTSLQGPEQGYYLVKEAIEQKNVEKVFFEVSFSTLTSAQMSDTSTYIVTDYMKSAKNKIPLLLSMDSTKYINGFLRLRRNINPLNVPSPGKMIEIYQKKAQADYKNYSGVNNNLGKGQWDAGKTPICPGGKLVFDYDTDDIDDFSVSDIEERPVSYLIKMMELCQKNNVELTLYCMPCTETYLTLFKEYEQFDAYLRALAGPYNVAVVNLNTVKDEYLRLTNKNFYKLEHVRASSSEKVSDFFVTYIENPEGDYFLSSYKDKYPISDDIISLGYHKTYLSESGEELPRTTSKIDIANMHLDISPYGYSEYAVDMSLWLVNKVDGEYTNVKEITLSRVDKDTFEFTIPYDEEPSSYRIQVFDSADGSLLYEAITKFDME